MVSGYIFVFSCVFLCFLRFLKKSNRNIPVPSIARAGGPFLMREPRGGIFCRFILLSGVREVFVALFFFTLPKMVFFVPEGRRLFLNSTLVF